MKHKRLYRIEKDRVLGGVCLGLADYFDIDPVLVRVIFVVLLLTGSFGFWLYIILWIVTPLKPINNKKKKTNS